MRIRTVRSQLNLVPITYVIGKVGTWHTGGSRLLAASYHQRNRDRTETVEKIAH